MIKPGGRFETPFELLRRTCARFIADDPSCHLLLVCCCRGAKVNALRKSVLLAAFSLDRLMRLRLHAWSASGADTLTVSEMFETATNAVWGDGGFASARAKLWRNWDLMLFWLEVLQASFCFRRWPFLCLLRSSTATFSLRTAGGRQSIPRCLWAPTWNPTSGHQRVG